jgi:calcium-binding protein CML
MSDLLSPSQLAEFTALFTAYDLDGDGRLSAAELHAALKARGEEVSLDEARGLITALDDDGNGNIDLEEFLEGMAIFTHGASSL